MKYTQPPCDSYDDVPPGFFIVFWMNGEQTLFLQENMHGDAIVCVPSYDFSPFDAFEEEWLHDIDSFQPLTPQEAGRWLIDKE